MTAADPEQTPGKEPQMAVEPTGDEIIDAAMADLGAADLDDIDAQIRAGERVHQALRTRLSDLGG